jgi:hypothetical protein
MKAAEAELPFKEALKVRAGIAPATVGSEKTR